MGGTFKTSRMLRCWGSRTHPETWATFSEWSKLFWAESQIISDEPLLIHWPFKGKYSRTLVLWQVPSPECSCPQQHCLLGYHHACTSSGNFLPGICMHIKALACHDHRIISSKTMSVSPDMVETEGFISKGIGWIGLQCSQPPYPTVVFSSGVLCLQLFLPFSYQSLIISETRTAPLGSSVCSSRNVTQDQALFYLLYTCQPT